MAVGSNPHRIRQRLVGAFMLVSLLPLALVGLGAWIVFGRLLDAKGLELQRIIVDSHASMIDQQFSERLRVVQFLADNVPLRDICKQSALDTVFRNLNARYPDAFIDLGVIGDHGRHIAYVGPYDLRGRNYSETDWFRRVMATGVYVSDVFLGFRQVPHWVIAVKQQDESGIAILRVTINSKQFDSVVHGIGEMGTTGDAFVINSAGIYQTQPKFGEVMKASPISSPERHDGVHNQRIEVNGVTHIRSTRWLMHDDWMLVVQQAESEIRAPVVQAMMRGSVVIALAMVLVTATTVAAVRHLTGEIERANQSRDEMHRAFMRSAQLASIGELATGLAHEINNPLAILSAEQTNIGDLVREYEIPADAREELLQCVDRSRRQIGRCGGITRKMLQFGRKSDSALLPTDVGTRLREVVALIGKQAEVRNIELQLSVEGELPPVKLDPVELDQVLINLLNNSFQSIARRGQVKMGASRRGDEIHIAVSDNGCGIPPEHVSRVFEPFFTTKPVGEGTGLGLSVCYGLVQTWGGTIELESRVGKGTVVTIRLPVPAPEHSAGPSSLRSREPCSQA
jgi:two-component system, NtrC family, sensor kinase